MIPRRIVRRNIQPTTYVQHYDDPIGKRSSSPLTICRGRHHFGCLFPFGVTRAATPLHDDEQCGHSHSRHAVPSQSSQSPTPCQVPLVVRALICPPLNTIPISYPCI